MTCLFCELQYQGGREGEAVAIFESIFFGSLFCFFSNRVKDIRRMTSSYIFSFSFVGFTVFVCDDSAVPVIDIFTLIFLAISPSFVCILTVHFPIILPYPLGNVAIAFGYCHCTLSG